MAQAMLVGRQIASGTGKEVITPELKVGDGQGADVRGQIISTIAIGNAPMLITSTTVVANLNVDQVDGFDASDLFNLDHASVTGVLDVNHGGTNIASYTTGDLIYASAAGILSVLGIGANSNVLTLAGGVPTWQAAGAPGAHATSHEDGGGDELELSDLATSELNAARVLVPDTLGGVSWATGQLLPTSTEQYAALVADAAGGWVEDTAFNINAGSVVDGTWTADIVALEYGGTESNLSATGPGALVQTASGLAVTVESALDETRGGTGQGGGSAYASGDILYATGPTTLARLTKGSDGEFLSLTAGVPDWVTGSLPAAGVGTGDLLYWNGSSWAVISAGAANTVLTGAGAAIPTWTDPGLGYDWVAEADAGGPKTISDGETLDIAGGNGISTALSGGATPYVNTITVQALAAPATTFVPVTVAAGGVSLNLADIDGLGLAANATTHLLDIDIGSTVDFSGDTPVWTFGNETTAEGLFVTGTPVDANHVVNKSYVDNLTSGLKWKEPVVVKSQGNINIAAPGANIDGEVMSAGDRVLMVLQTTTTQDGIWTWNGAAVAMTRTTDAATGSDFSAAACIVMQGTDAETGWVCTDDTGSAVIGTDDLTMVQFTGAGQLVAGNGITISTNTVSVDPATPVAGSRAAVYVGADGVGVNLDNSTLDHAASVLQVKADGITATEIDETDAYTWTGAHDFQSTFKVDQIDESTAAAGVTVDGLLVRDGTVADPSFTTGVGVALYDICRIDAAGEMEKADANLDCSSVFGVALEAKGAATTVAVARSGKFEVNMVAALTVDEGDPVYVSLTAGSCTNDVSAFASGDSICRVGFITDISNYGSLRVEIEINIGEPVLIA